MILKDLKQIDEVTWEIPTSFKKGMLVPARIIATKKLFDAMDDGVFEQITNVAMLPGVQNYVIAMSDSHFGYGFPVGGVAAMDLEEGVISPGGIGFDINCLAKGSRILTKHGYTKKIEEFEKEFYKENLITIDLKKKNEDSSQPVLFMKKPVNKEKVYRFITKSGKEVIVTEDHPIYTKTGMKISKDLREGNEIAVFPFEGVPYEKPEDDFLITEEEFKEFIKDRSLTSQIQVVNILKEKGLLPLVRSSDKLPYLIKLIGFLTGDGNITFTKKTQSISFYANEEDLGDIRKDVTALGFTPSRIRARTRKHSIKTRYDLIEFERTEYSFTSMSSALILLLKFLEAPLGKKTELDFRIPKWLFKCPLWQKRLYLATLFGAELSSPSTKKNLGYTFNTPTLSMNKHEDHINSGFEFLNDIKRILDELSIKTREISIRDEYDGLTGKTYRLRLFISDESMLDLYKYVNIEYNKKKRFLANLALQYLTLKKKIIEERVKIQKQVILLYNNGMKSSEIYEKFSSEHINKRFLQRSLFEGRKTSPRIAYNFISFNDFVEKYALNQSGVVWDFIEKKEEVQYSDWVYDFTVDNKSHNFIANNLVVSNCGMKILRTNLTIKDVKPKIKEIVHELFDSVPTGVGASSKLKLTDSEIDELSRYGVKWCVDNGYGWKNDDKKIEEHGYIKWADPSKVSQEARNRGRKQVGTLGSGNHYLEVQFTKPEFIFDEKIANGFGINGNDQILIMVHCGSRGFGHQIATDYLKIFDKAMKKYNITIPDRELSCAPLNTKEGQDYVGAMTCAANYAFANRQMIIHNVREAFSKVFKQSAEDMEMEIIYDVAHNIAKIEKYKVDGRLKELLIHRKGATRSFGPGNEELWGNYSKYGQPVIVGGSMETGSYLLVGTKKAEETTFGSTLHGSGRTMSRTKAKGMVRGDKLQRDMEERGIYVKAASMPGLAEEAGLAYKDINEVVKSVELAGISKPVVKLSPLGNIKGTAGFNIINLFFLLLVALSLISIL
nr:RtcB family protein [Candidatus Woesearchaeota archaeon]